jgi:hypothetical protein
MGEEMVYTIAVDDAQKTTRAFNEPFGIQGIPHCFIVDAKGRIMWHGNPLDIQRLDKTLAAVVAGTYDLASAREEAAQERRSAEFSQLVDLWAQEYQVLCRFGRDTERADAIGALVLEHGAENVGALSNAAGAVLVEGKTWSYRDFEFAIKAAEKACEATDRRHPIPLMVYGMALFERGEIEQAVATQKSAIALAGDNARLLEALTERLAEYEAALAAQ